MAARSQQSYARPTAGKKSTKKSELTAEQMQELREAFNLFDTDNSGASGLYPRRERAFAHF